MTSETERLQQLYRELDRAQLEDLSADPADLTDEAQLALAGEMRHRGLSPRALKSASTQAEPAVSRIPDEAPEHSYGFGVGIPGIVPGSEPAMEHALEPGGSTRLGMTALTSFSDGLELSRACDLLSSAQIEPAIEEIAGDENTGTIPRYEVWVAAAEAERSRQLLQAHMGLFPPAEIDESAGALDGGTYLIVAQFETRPEAEEVSAELRESGFTPRIEAEQDSVAVLVPAPDYERALNLLTSRMQLE